tara:strand:- start:507 stop:701 length:195 start_codon:yes stop_codon:yes gene_type:complete
MSEKSLAERKKSFLEDCCGAAPTMSMGDAGYQSASPAEGPTAGYDQPLGKKKKLMDTVRKLKKK